MVQLIPPQISDRTDSSAERLIFRKLQETSLNDDYFILHSLGLVEHEKKRRWAEVDFLLVGPRGILAVEVKGGRISRDKQGYWFTKNRDDEVNPLTHSPFEQASSGLHAVLNWLDKNGFSGISNWAVAGYAVMFPNSKKPNDGSSMFGPEAGDDIVYWLENTKQDISFYLGACFSHFEARHPKSKALSKPDVTAIVGALRGQVEIPVAPQWKRISSLDLQIQLTEQQWDAFQSSRTKQRVLVYGGAGTGKTVIAKNIAKSAANNGHATLLLCFNRKLGDAMSDDLKGVNNLTVGSIHKLAFDALPKAIANEYNGNPEGLLQEFLGFLLDGKFPAYEFVVVDEGQDLLNSDFLDVFELLVKDGTTSGKWVWLMDPNHQAGVFGKYESKSHEKLKAIAESIKSLDLNCRNTHEIVEYVRRLIPNYEHPCARIDGVPVDTFTCKNEAVVKDKVTEQVARFVDMGLTVSEIVILGPKSPNNSSLADSLILDADGDRCALKIPNFGAVDYHSISSFKGLESPGVILIDATNLDSGWWESVIYVAVTRATFLLSIMATPEFLTEAQNRESIYYERSNSLY